MSALPNLAEILGKIGDGICVLTGDREVSFANESASRILEAAGVDFHHKIALALKERAARRFEHFHPSMKRWFEHQTHPNLDGGLTLVSREISERRRADERLRSLVEGGKILASSLECEKTFAELAEFIASKLAGSCMIFVAEEGEFIEVAAANSALAIDAPSESDLNRVIASGESETRSAPTSRILVPIMAGKAASGVLVVTSASALAFDSEDRHLLEELGRRAGQALENARLYYETQRANRLKDEFVAIVSHELRTPLTPILGGVYMLRNESHDPRVFARALDLIERNANIQVKIVDDLLDVSRALSGKLHLNMELVDLAVVIQAAVETVRPAGEAKGIQIDVKLGAVKGALSGDPDRLQQVVWNLLANSVKFTPPGGRILVELRETPGHAQIRVTDTGIGIEADFLPHVFDRFRQADASRTRLHGGLGLGLAIVRHLVESHGGTVHAHSYGGEQGSTFVVRLPLRAVARAGHA